MKRRNLALLLTVCMAGTMLAGCSGGKEAKSEPEAPAAETTKAAGTGEAKAPETEAAKEEAAASGEKVTVQFWHSMDGTKNDLIEQMCSDFNEAHPDIEIVPTYQGGYWEAAAKAQSAVAAGDAPDILQMGADHVCIFAQEDGLLADLKPYFEKSGMSTDDLVPAFSWDYFVNDQLLALPFGRSTPVLFVNNDMLKENGLTIPTTWDEWRSACQALVLKDDGGEYTRYGMTMPYDTWYWFMIVAQAGGQFINDERTGLGCVEDQTMYNGFKFWQDMHNDGSMYFGPVTDSDSTCRQMFLEGKSGFYLSSVGNLNTMEENAKFDLELAWVPKGVEQVVPTGGCSIVMMGSSPNKDAAWEFMKWILEDPKGGESFCLNTGYLPYTYTMTESDAYKKLYEEDPNAKKAFEQLQFASDKGHRVPQVGTIMTDLQSAIQAIMYDNEDVSEQVDILAEAVADIMQE